MPTEFQVTVIEGFLSISGLLFSVLECKQGMLEPGTILIGDEGIQWKIIESGLVTGGKKFIQHMKDNSWFLYELEAIDHTTKPQPRTILKAIPPANHI